MVTPTTLHHTWQKLSKSTNLADIKGNKKDNMEILVKLVNTTLASKSPENLIKGLEHFVALLRNSKSASNVDVELFF